MRALLSVYDKTGIVEFARGLQELEWELYSTGGTKDVLGAAGVEVHSVSELTGFPEILGGRVKTIHPAIVAGILADRNDPGHVAQLAEHGIHSVDLVAVNLYPFVEAVGRTDATGGRSRPGEHHTRTGGRSLSGTAGDWSEDGAGITESSLASLPASGVSLAEILENIDVGGVTLVRAAAKNFQQVVVAVRPQDYEPVLHELRDTGQVTVSTRCALAARAFQHTASYDTFIAQYFGELASPEFPEELTLPLKKAGGLRYGENPHQRAAFYRLGDERMGGPSLAEARQLHGRELSYNNLLDADAAWALTSEFAAPTVAIIKHHNPCGVGCGETASEAYRKAFAGDPLAAWGGILSTNRPVDAGLAVAIRANWDRAWLEIIVAPAYDSDALRMLQRRSRNVRLLELPLPLSDSSPTSRLPMLQLHYRQVLGGMLVQTRDENRVDEMQLKVATDRRPTLEELTDLQFAWRVVKHVRSNAIVVAKHLGVLGVGAGQMSRIDSVHMALHIAERGGAGRAQEAVLSSDGLLPFPDWVELAGLSGITACIQPGGAINDDQIIAACNARGMAMVFTGQRHFRH